MVLKSQIYKTTWLTLFGLFALIASTFNFSHAAEPKRVALLPFKINSEKDMSFLRDGIFDMFTSRLSKEGAVVVLGRQETESALKSVAGPDAINESLARTIGAQLNADYTLFGSLTVFGDSISIDAKMVDVAAQTPTMAFFDQSQDLGGVITKINLIAAQINEQMLGQRPSAPLAQKAAPQDPAATPPQRDDRHAHPEKLLKGAGAEDEGSPFIMMKEPQTDFQKFWRSASFRHLINGLALGDVDRDGKIETVVVTPHSVIVYRSEGGKFYQAHQSPESKTSYNIGVDVADINENGYAEIFVTSLNATRQALSSSVFEYDGKTYAKIVANSPWYFRVVDLPARGKILLGQRHRTGNPFSSGIYDMIWKNSEYKPETEIKTPSKTQLMGFALGDVLNDNQETAVAYKENDHIQIIDAAGKEMWKSGERYGGSTLYYAGRLTDIGEVQNPQYYPMRLVVADANGDGETEVIVVKNHEIGRMKLEKFRKFTNAHVESLFWDGLGLAPSWKTRKISGFIRDFALGDFDNDGKIELIAAVIVKEGAIIMTTPKSILIAYELPS